MKTIYVDQLRLRMLPRLIFSRIKSVKILDEPAGIDNIALRIVRFLSIEVEECIFFTGDLRTLEGKSIFLEARVRAGEVAVEYTKSIFNDNIFLRKINAIHGGNTLVISVAKTHQDSLEYVIVRVLVAVTLSGKKDVSVWLGNSGISNKLIKKNFLPEYSLRMYNKTGGFKSWISSILLLVGFLKLNLKELLASFSSCSFSSATKGIEFRKEAGVIIFQEDSISLDFSYRGQPNWIDFNEGNGSPYSIIVSNLSLLCRIVPTHDELKKYGIKIFESELLKYRSSAIKRFQIFRLMRFQRFFLLILLLFTVKWELRDLFQKIYNILTDAEDVGVCAVLNNVFAIVFRETHLLSTDSVQLVAPALGIKTICIQYSNIGARNALIVSTADYFLSFSAKYEKLFQYKDISPRKFMQVGYLYDKPNVKLKERSLSLKNSFREKGATFVACYFDESIQNDRWGFVSYEKHRIELEELLLEVNADPSFGVIIKTQFVRNLPSELFPNSKIIQDAFKTGRCIELVHGTHRNEILPAEAGMASDFCIGHKVGATAILETALLKIPSVLLDTHDCPNEFDSVYQQADILFPSMKNLLENIRQYRNIDPNSSLLGDWSQVLHNFCSDGHMGSVHLRELLQSLLALRQASS